jgi:hypothetical protein
MGDENKMWVEKKNNILSYDVLSGTKHKSLPINGWIQTCYFCSTPTSKIKILSYDNKFYYVFRCKECTNYTLENN